MTQYGQRDETPKVVRSARKGLSDRELIAFINSKISTALNGDHSDLTSVRSENLRFWRGEPWGAVRPGRSSYVDRTVFEAVEWAMPAIVRPFVGSDRVVVYEAQGPEDEEAARQETDVANYYLTRKNNGFMAIYLLIRDALLNPNTYGKVYWESTKRTCLEEYTGISDEDLVALAQDPDVEIVAHSEEEKLIEMPAPPMPPMPPGGPQGPGAPPPMPQGPQMVPYTCHNVDIRRTKTMEYLRIDPVPPEDLLVDDDLRCLDLDEADFVAHRRQITRSKLIEMGFSRAVVDSLPAGEEGDHKEEKINRQNYAEEQRGGTGTDDRSQEQVTVYECFLLIDADDDGISERRRVLMAGNEILENEEVDYQPFVSGSVIPQPHKHIGVGLAETVKDLQKLHSVLKRGLLDNVYRFDSRRKTLNVNQATDDTIPALENPQSEVIPVEGDARTAVAFEQTQSAVAEIIPAIQHFEEAGKRRSGVAPDLDLDPSVLQQATGIALMSAKKSANQRIELIVRVLAETLIKQLMVKIHQLLRKHQDKELAIKLRGTWANVDPTTWRERTDVEVNVGVGFADKNEQVQTLQGILAVQQQLLPLNLAGPKELYATVRALVEAADVGEVSQFLLDPSEPGWQPPQPPPPSPTEQAQAATIQAQGEKLKADAQKTLAEAQALMLEAQSKPLLEQAKLQQAQAKAQADLERAQMEAMVRAQELQLQQAQLALKAQESAHRFALEPQKVRAGIGLTEAQTVKTMAETAKTTVEAHKASTEPDEPEEREGKRDDDRGS